MHLYLLASTNYLNALALRQALTVRVHTALVHRLPWAKLWYLCRGLDLPGRGMIYLPELETCQLLQISQSRLRQWLQTGKAAGAFRHYRRRGNDLRIYLGGLHKYCLALGLPNWGATVDVPLSEVLTDLKQIATAAQAQHNQTKSRIAAIRSLKPKEREFYKLPEVHAILEVGKASSQKPAKGQVPFLVWVGKSKAFVSKGFVPFGSCQEAIADELGISVRSIRRHLKQLGVEKRQLVQAKHAYKLMKNAIHWEVDQCYAEPNIWYEELIDGSLKLYEPNGITSSFRKEGHQMSRERLFNYRGKTWIYRCNIYDLDYTSCSMRAARKVLAQLIGKKTHAGVPLKISKNNQSRKEADLKVAPKRSPRPGEEGQNS